MCCKMTRCVTNGKLLLAMKSLVFVVLVGFFVYHVWEQIDKFLSKKTMTLEMLQTLESLRLPALTVCSDVAYKRPGFHFNASAFEEHAYKWDDLFHPSTTRFLQEKEMSVKEVRSQFRGLCFTLTSQRRFAAKEYLTLSLRAPDHGPDIYVFAHEPGEEFFLVGENFPMEVATDTVGEGADCTINKKKVHRSLHNPRHHKVCSDWDGDLSGFFSCADVKLREAIVQAGFNCSVVWWADFFPEGARECDANVKGDLQEVIRFGAWVDDPWSFPLHFSSYPEKHGCPRPCKQVEYDIGCREFDMDFEYVKLTETPAAEGKNATSVGTEVWFYYLRTEEELEEEILFYDFSQIVAGVGGSLGLFLGFSCLQVCFSGIELGFQHFQGGQRDDDGVMRKKHEKRRQQRRISPEKAADGTGDPDS